MGKGPSRERTCRFMSVKVVDVVKSIVGKEAKENPAGPPEAL
jgi:hypothetical protein